MSKTVIEHGLDRLDYKYNVDYSVLVNYIFIGTVQVSELICLYCSLFILCFPLIRCSFKLCKR